MAWKKSALKHSQTFSCASIEFMDMLLRVAILWFVIGGVMLDTRYTEINSKTIDSWVAGGWEWGTPVSKEVCELARQGKWDVLLTPLKPMPHEWFEPCIKGGRLDGVKLLGLASGGGQQMPIFSLLGADCAILDYSDSQLESERAVSEREGYRINIVKADMTLRLPFEDETFDLIFHPVSNCYVEDVKHIWKECFRVLKPGGILVAGMGNGYHYLFDDMTVSPLAVVNKLPYNPLKDPEIMRKCMESNSGLQFSHTFEELIGGQLQAGLALTDVYEDYDYEPGIVETGYPAYWATRAVKPHREGQKNG
jgi:SAM-dependent methyltransferase